MDIVREALRMLDDPQYVQIVKAQENIPLSIVEINSLELKLRSF